MFSHSWLNMVKKQQYRAPRMSGLKNNLDTLALKYYYGIDIQGIPPLESGGSNILDYLNGNGSDTSKPRNVNVINSSTGNVQDKVDYEANAAIFKIIKESIASETETKNWNRIKRSGIKQPR